jgi:hypothetical protein
MKTKSWQGKKAISLGLMSSALEKHCQATRNILLAKLQNIELNRQLAFL